MSLVDDLATRCRFPDRDELTCAISGGPDSLALLVLAAGTGRTVRALHVDHGLRPDSAADAIVVAEVAERFGASFESFRVRIDPGPNLEARAREERYSVLPADVLTGHTADDQAETILLNLMRGAGIEGLAGMRRDRRPLLDLRRGETVGLCQSLGLHPIADPTNDDPRFRRNRVRADLLPLLDDIAQREVGPLIVRQADHLRELADWLDQLAGSVDTSSVRELRECPAPVARVAVRKFIREHTGSGHPPSSAALARAFDVVRGDARAAQLGNGWTLKRRDGLLSVEQETGLG